MTVEMARLRLLPVLLVASLVAALAAGCGGASTSAPARQLSSLASVAERTAAADTVRFDLALEMTFPGAPEPFAFSMDGAFDSALERAQMTIDLSSVMSMIGALGGSLGGELSGELGSPDDWKLETIMDGEVVYVKVPKFAADQVPGGKTWVKGDLDTLSQAGGSSLDLGSFGGGDPRELLQFLEAVSDDLETVGRESQRGVDTTHYRATVDLAELLEMSAGKQAASALGGLDQMLEQSGLASIPIDVWVDDDDLLRRLDLELSMSQPGQGEAEASMTFELYDYGKPLFIELPAPADVADASALQLGS